MYQVMITEREAGQRFDKYLHRILPNAGAGFLHKMLRKKNITLNDKKADGSEKIAEGDCVKVFFAQETLDLFMGKPPEQSENSGKSVKSAGQAAGQKPYGQDYRTAYKQISGIRTIYEDGHILIADKPAGVLSQKAVKTDLSLNEWLIGYLLEKEELSESELTFYKPSVCNRLDRNTSGMVLCAKTLQGAQMLSSLLKDRTLHKYYQLYVKGHIAEEHLIEGYLVKDEKRNKVVIKPVPCKKDHSGIPEQAVGKQEHTGDKKTAYIQTRYKPLRIEADKTLLEVELITGKPHQIRAHLASIGHPLLGDYKYGDRAWNEKYRQHFGVQSQLLHAYKVIFPPLAAPFADLGGRTFYCEVPEIFKRVSDFI
ncbi:MAG: RluA family pseudouridine synthase [Lachnospiraceae bacterium]|nr:RluA family pseudouridine synthase [Lachnospiraceae bacterium]